MALGMLERESEQLVICESLQQGEVTRGSFMNAR
jgi:hypothetical protein